MSSIATVIGIDRIGGYRVPEVEITRSLTDPALRIKAFIDCAKMLTWRHPHFVSKATMVFAHISDDHNSVTWKFKFQNTDAAKAFNKEFDNVS